MKRFIAWLLLIAMMLSLWGCAPAEAPAPTEVTTLPPETAPAPTAPPETVSETEPEILEGNLFLTVSALTFSVVGEQEDIYLGLIPRELVSWESENEQIVSVEAGVLTATGVGTTTVRASYYDRQVSCTVSCLAPSEEALHALDNAILSQPKRLPPEIDMEEACTYFDNAAIVGDSITFFLEQLDKQNNGLGDILFLARGGVSMNSLVRGFKNVYYNGKERKLEKAVAASGVSRVYFLMGSNDVSSRNQRKYVFENWDILIGRLREVKSDIELVLLSNIPLYGNQYQSREALFLERNGRIPDYNARLKEYARDNDCLFLDLYAYVEDHMGRMPECYSQGSYHMNPAGCLNWMKVLRHYARFEQEGGSLRLPPEAGEVTP